MSHWYKVTDKQASSWDHKTVALPATPFLLVSPFIAQSFWFSKYIIASPSCRSRRCQHSLLFRHCCSLSFSVSWSHSSIGSSLCTERRRVDSGVQYLFSHLTNHKKPQNWCTSKLLKPVTYPGRNAQGPLFQPINDQKPRKLRSAEAKSQCV